MEKQFELLGWEVEDKVTGFRGVVSHVGLDLYGCVQALVQPKTIVEKGEQKLQDQRWFDTARLVKQGRKAVMAAIPIKGDAVVAVGSNDKPGFTSAPTR